MIKNIVFDLGSVIVKGSSKEILSNKNFDKEASEILLEIFLDQKIFDELDLGFITIEETFNKNSNYIPKKLLKKAKDIFCNYYKYRYYDEGVIELIKLLSHNGYNIYILSNNNNEAVEYLKKKEWAKYIKGWLISSDCHLVKPNEEIYYLFYKMFNLNPEECLFIDDKKINIVAGIKTGMDGIVFKNSDNLKTELLNRKVKLDTNS